MKWYQMRWAQKKRRKAISGISNRMLGKQSEKQKKEAGVPLFPKERGFQPKDFDGSRKITHRPSDSAAGERSHTCSGERT